MRVSPRRTERIVDTVWEAWCKCSLLVYSYRACICNMNAIHNGERSCAKKRRFSSPCFWHGLYISSTNARVALCPVCDADARVTLSLSGGRVRHCLSLIYYRDFQAKMGFRAYIPVSVSAARQRLKAGAARKVLLKKLIYSLYIVELCT